MVFLKRTLMPFFVFMELKEFFERYDNVALAFSGGVDSSYLLYAAMKYKVKVRAYYVKAAFQPEFEFEDARRLANDLGADMKIIKIDLLGEENVVTNPADRCYHCKNKIFGTILAEAHKDGFDVIIDGTNASDDVNDRPGMRALKELEVLSPLRLCGLTKDQVRTLSKEAGLFTWDKPSYACLATRIRTGERITAEKLRITEECEAFLTEKGFKDFRIRMIGDSAKIQLRKEQLPLIIELREEILSFLGERYKSVLLDLEVRG